MSDVVQVHALIPRTLKRHAFSVLALRERKFSHWLREQIEAWLEEAERTDEGMARPENDPEGIC